MVKKSYSTASASSPDESRIEVTAQQSRFHAGSAESTPGKEIIISDLSITIGGRELLSHAELNLQPGRRYVLIGRNGLGKSTLLKAVGNGLVPGISSTLKVLLLGQTTSSFDQDCEIHSEDDRTETVLQHVIRSNKQRERLLEESRRLSEASENSIDSMAMIKVYRELTHQRLQRQVNETSIISARQSGARGFKVRRTLQNLEEELAQSTTRLSNLVLPEAADEASEIKSAFDMLAEVQLALDLMNTSTAEATARSVLLGLGFSVDSLNMPRAQLSGGWQTRCILACALCQPSELLLLDEPTNFLDLPSIIWLENFIKTLGAEKTVIVVTHDRAFADAVAEELLVLRNLSLERFRGNLSAYELDKLETYKYLSHMQEVQDKQKKHIEATIDSNVKAAKRSGDDKKLKQASSRKKKLDERMGMQVSSKGTRFKLNRDMAGFHNNRRHEIEVPTFDPPARVTLPASPPDLRHPGALLSFEGVAFAYPRAKTPILTDINLVIHPGARVGLAGLNGCGKSTLVRLAMSDNTARLPVLRGNLSRHPGAKFGIYSQASVEKLDELAHDDPLLTALTHLTSRSGLELQEKEARGLLSSLGLTSKVQSDVPMTLLSGGQKVRLALAKVLWDAPHLLVLDEVTTHLDSDTIQALALALQKYEGAILVVTHDRFFMRCVVEGQSPKSLARSAQTGAEDSEDQDSSSEDDEAAKAGVVYRLSKGVLTKLDRGMEQYEERAAKASAKLGKA